MHNYTASIYSDTRSNWRLTAEYFCSRDSISILKLLWHEYEYE